MSTDKKASRFRQPVNIISNFALRRIRNFLLWLWAKDYISTEAWITVQRWLRRAGR